jgi:hypothetical protein
MIVAAPACWAVARLLAFKQLLHASLLVCQAGMY